MASKRNGRLTLGLLALVCALPVAASYLAYYVWQPQGQVNYGELLEPLPLPAELASAAAPLRGRWALVYGSRGCDAACEQALYFMRQVRTAQGEHMERVERLWLRAAPEAPRPELLAEHPGLRVVGVEAPVLAALPSSERVLLLDPLGNVMMRFPAEPDPKRMIRDLTRLLKYSRIG